MLKPKRASSVPKSQIQSSTKVLRHLTVSTKNWHYINLPLPTPNAMLISVHPTVRQYFNTVFGGKGARKIEQRVLNTKGFGAGYYSLKCPKDFCRGL